jgi:hypothetical protein
MRLFLIYRKRGPTLAALTKEHEGDAAEVVAAAGEGA